MELKYRELQQALKALGAANLKVKLNHCYEVLAAEYHRLTGDWSAWYSDKLVISYDRYHKMPWSISTNQYTTRYATLDDYNEVP